MRTIGACLGLIGLMLGCGAAPHAAPREHAFPAALRSPSTDIANAIARHFDIEPRSWTLVQGSRRIRGDHQTFSVEWMDVVVAVPRHETDVAIFDTARGGYTSSHIALGEEAFAVNVVALGHSGGWSAYVIVVRREGTWRVVEVVDRTELCVEHYAPHP